MPTDQQLFGQVINAAGSLFQQYQQHQQQGQAQNNSQGVGQAPDQGQQTAANQLGDMIGSLLDGQQGHSQGDGKDGGNPLGSLMSTFLDGQSNQQGQQGQQSGGQQGGYQAHYQSQASLFQSGQQGNYSNESYGFSQSGDQQNEGSFKGNQEGHQGQGVQQIQGGYQGTQNGNEFGVDHHKQHQRHHSQQHEHENNNQSVYQGNQGQYQDTLGNAGAWQTVVQGNEPQYKHHKHGQYRKDEGESGPSGYELGVGVGAESFGSAPGGAVQDGWLDAPASWHAAAYGRHVHPKADYKDNRRNTADPEYRRLRDQARDEGDAMARAFDASHSAYDEGDKARAKELSDEGHTHQGKMDKLNAQAARWIFQANNRDSGSNEIDLHGLYVKEALSKAEDAVAEARRRHMPELRIIAGQGEHSADHKAKIQPAIEKLMRDQNLSASLDEHNRGVVIVHLEKQGQFNSSSSRELSNSLESNDACVVM